MLKNTEKVRGFEGYIKHLENLRGDMIQNGIAVPTFDLVYYEDCFKCGQILEQLYWFYQRLLWSGNESSVRLRYMSTKTYREVMYTKSAKEAEDFFEIYNELTGNSELFEDYVNKYGDIEEDEEPAESGFFSVQGGNEEVKTEGANGFEEDEEHAESGFFSVQEGSEEVEGSEELEEYIGNLMGRSENEPEVNTLGQNTQVMNFLNSIKSMPSIENTSTSPKTGVLSSPSVVSLSYPQGYTDVHGVFLEELDELLSDTSKVVENKEVHGVFLEELEILLGNGSSSLTGTSPDVHGVFLEELNKYLKENENSIQDDSEIHGVYLEDLDSYLQDDIQEVEQTAVRQDYVITESPQVIQVNSTYGDNVDSNLTEEPAMEKRVELVPKRDISDSMQDMVNKAKGKILSFIKD